MLTPCVNEEPYTAILRRKSDFNGSITASSPNETEKLFHALKLFIGEPEEDYEGSIHELSLGGPRIEAAALDGVAGVVAEDADAVVQHGQIVLVRLVPVQRTAAALPRLAVHQDVPPAGQLVQLGPQQVHRLHIVQAHQATGGG